MHVRVDPRCDEHQTVSRSAASAKAASASSGAGSRVVAGSRTSSSGEHGTEAANVPDRREALLPGEHPRTDSIAPITTARGTSSSSSITSSTASAAASATRWSRGPADGALDRRVHDLGAAEHARERETGRDRLRDRDEVGLDAEVLEPEEAAGAAEAGLHLVDDQHDPVRVAEAADAGRNSGGLPTKPPSPWTGSRTIAATDPAETCMTNARSSAASAVAAAGPR